MGLLARFVPNLIPGLGALLNPWILLGLLSAIVSSFLYGMYVEHGHSEARELQHEVVQANYDAWAKMRNAGHERINQETVDEYEDMLAKLGVDNDVLTRKLRDIARQTVLPANTSSAGGDCPSGAFCVNRDAFERGYSLVQEAGAARDAAIVRKYDRAKAVVLSCINWDAKQRRLEVDLPSPQ